MSYNMTEPDYDYEDNHWQIEETRANAVFFNGIRMLYIISYFIICSLGVTLNSYVIITGLKGKFQKSTTRVWVLALAMTHLVFSSFLMLQLLYAWHHFNWHFGTALCKLSSYITYASMFSTGALLSLWSASSRCPKGTRCGSRGPSTVLVMVICSWTFGVLVSSPSLLYRELHSTEIGVQCIDDYDSGKESATPDGVKKMTTVLLSRLVLGVLVPMLVMGASACLVRPLDHNLKSCKRIICAIKVGYFICWTPLLVLRLVKVAEGSPFAYALPATTVLAAAHCFINPVIYLLVGCKISMDWMSKEPRAHENQSGECMHALNGKE
ncbi:chemokine-like receptor 1 [Colossoma macropomum]|uniref:chemokine-like receptor 1 n=1 Tax=Colossoma macropomum TaxID=42526 RepID=UPI00186481A5|nr:chemokine-like receptor 1 [Colossoma macropomum]